jgi:ATP-dependent DNA ligase
MFPIAGTAAAALIRINTIRRRDRDAPQKMATITPRVPALGCEGMVSKRLGSSYAPIIC